MDRWFERLNDGRSPVAAEGSCHWNEGLVPHPLGYLPSTKGMTP